MTASTKNKKDYIYVSHKFQNVRSFQYKIGEASHILKFDVIDHYILSFCVILHFYSLVDLSSRGKMFNVLSLSD